MDEKIGRGEWGVELVGNSLVCGLVGSSVGHIIPAEVSVAGCSDELDVGEVGVSLKDMEGCRSNAALKILEGEVCWLYACTTFTCYL